MQQVVDKIMAPHRPMLSEIVGHTEIELHRNTIFEAPMDNLLLKAITEAPGATIAFSNGWRYGAPILPGPVTRNDLWNIVPTNLPVSLTQLIGREIWEMLEENLEHTFASDPYRQMGGYVKRTFDLKVNIKIGNPKGARVQSIFAEGAPLDKERLYTAAFVTTQGISKKYGRNRRDLEMHAVQALESYFAKHPSQSIGMRGSVVSI